MNLTAKRLETKGWYTSLVFLQFIFAGIILSSCGFKSDQVNVLVVSIENFGSTAINCLDDSQGGESKTILCDEFVRFSHAYTSSSLSQPAIASILSGYYPFQNNVWNNGDSYLSEKFWTISELAFERGYATSFFSGGGSIWRKSGFSQGFEVFDEHDYLGLTEVYRPSGVLNQRFLNWVEKNKEKRSFFSFLYYPDLQFPTMPTVDDLDVERSLSKRSQLLEVKESLGSLFSTLKEKKLWDKTLVIVAGLNGLTPIDRNSEFSPLNLHSENTQVGLFIKPPRKQRDKGLNWTIDANVNLVDLGASLFDFLGQKQNSKGSLAGRSLIPYLNTRDKKIKSDQALLVESGWAQWKGLGNTRSALFLEKKFFFYQDPIIYYNTLIDQKESIPIAWQDISAPEEKRFILDLFQSAGFDMWSGLSYFEIRKFKLGQLLWREGLDRYLYEELRLLAEKSLGNQEIFDWLAYHSVLLGDYDRLAKLGEAAGEYNWVYVAKKTSKNKLAMKTKPQLFSGCFRKLVDGNKEKKSISRGENLNQCEDELVESLFSWKHGERSKRDVWRESFIQQYSMFLERRELAKLNIISGYSWSVVSAPYLKLHPVELFLLLKENSFHRDLVSRRLGNSPFRE